MELNKWQSEADTLRQHLSENRMQLAKGNMTMSKELQERESKIQELTVAYRQLQVSGNFFFLLLTVKGAARIISFLFCFVCFAAFRASLR